MPNKQLKMVVNNVKGLVRWLPYLFRNTSCFIKKDDMEILKNELKINENNENIMIKKPDKGVVLL